MRKRITNSGYEGHVGEKEHSCAVRLSILGIKPICGMSGDFASWYLFMKSVTNGAINKWTTHAGFALALDCPCVTLGFLWFPVYFCI